MRNCPVCGGKLLTIHGNLADSFACEECGNPLQARLYPRFIFLWLGLAIGTLLRFATLAFNPRMNPQKIVKFSFAVEALLTRLFWRTNCVRITRTEGRVART